MFSEGESELRDLVVQNLESCGFLNKIKAELRAGVFLALSEEGSLKKKVPMFNKKLDDFVNTSDGKLALSVVREFLEYFNLNFTLSVFDPEVSSSSPYTTRKLLCEQLNLNESEFEGPILSTLFKKLGTTKLSDLDLGPAKTKSQEKKSGDLADKISASDESNEKSSLSGFQINAEHGKDFFDDKNETLPNESTRSDDISSFSTNKVGSNKNFFNFSKPEEKDIFKDQSIDHFFDDPVPLEKPNFLNLGSTNTLNDTLSPTFPTSEKGSVLSDQKKLSSTHLPSEKGSLSSLRNLPSLTKQDNSINKESLPVSLGSDILVGGSGNVGTFKEDLAKKDADPESNEEYSDRQINSEESIEEEIEEEFSAGLDELLNSSLSLGDDATSDQTVSQASVVDGVDHIESCNTVN